MIRKYVIASLAGLGMFVAVHVVDVFLSHLGLHAEATYLDDFLLALLAAIFVLTVQWHHERELHRQRQSAAVISQMNHHIRNALQVIVYRLDPGARGSEELRELRASVDRIDWALREILPSLGSNDSDSEGLKPESR
ncbi:MAG: hypothetical protein ACM3JB_06345 [Acidobacteriaceae bacterium]